MEIDVFLYDIWKRFVSNKRFAQSTLVALTSATSCCCKLIQSYQKWLSP